MYAKTILCAVFAVIMFGVYLFIRRREADRRRSDEIDERDTRIQEGLAEASGTAGSIEAGLTEASGTAESCAGHLETAESILQEAINRSRKEDEAGKSGSNGNL